MIVIRRTCDQITSLLMAIIKLSLTPILTSTFLKQFHTPHHHATDLCYANGISRAVEMGMVFGLLDLQKKCISQVIVNKLQNRPIKI